MQRPTTQALLVALVALVAALAIACGGDSGSPVPPAPTQDPTARRATEEARPTVDRFGPRAAEQIRAIERGLERLDRSTGRLDDNIARTRDQSGGAPEEPPSGWFDECCEEDEEDISEELLEVEDELAKLIAIYQDAGDEPNLLIVGELGTPLANIRTLLAVLAGLPTSDGAAAIVDDMFVELAAFTEALTGLT